MRRVCNEETRLQEARYYGLRSGASWPEIWAAEYELTLLLAASVNLKLQPPSSFAEVGRAYAEKLCEAANS